MAGSGTPRFSKDVRRFSHPTHKREPDTMTSDPPVFSPDLRAAVPGHGWPLVRWSRLPGRNMEDLPAVEPVKIYENTYRLEPADNEK